MQFGVDFSMARLAPLTSRTRMGAPPAAPAPLGQVQEPVEGAVGVGEVGLQSDPGREVGEFVVVQDTG